jgi:phosphatidylserine decarboxylase
MIRISKYGYDVVLIAAAITIVAVGISLLVELVVLKLVLIVFFVLFFVFTLYFFRDPDRTVPVQENIVISPADGKVLQINRVHERDYLCAEAIQVSIFMSPFNVHVNRAPISGKVGYHQYIPGDYIVAFDERASERNERTLIGIENGSFRILMKQVAGFVARRIVCRLRKGDEVKQGERFGMIRFGSRVDLILPVSIEVKVGLKDKVLAGKSIIGIIH